MPSSNHVTSGSATGSAAPVQASSVPRSRASSELMDHTRRRLFSPAGDNEEANELDASSSGEEDGVPKFKRPDIARSLAGCQAAEDKDFDNLMSELRVLANKVLREDEWKYRSSDDILGFRD